MEKKLIRKTLISHAKRVRFGKPYTWGEIQEILKANNVELQNGDEITVGFESGWDESDSARDDMYEFKLYRMIMETDDEFEKRKNEMLEYRKDSYEKRHQLYLKLKNEFEPPTHQL